MYALPLGVISKLYSVIATLPGNWLYNTAFIINIGTPYQTTPKIWKSSFYYLSMCLKYSWMSGKQRPRSLILVYVVCTSLRKHAYANI